MLTIAFFNTVVYTEDEELADAVTFDFTTDGFHALISTRIFSIPIVDVDGRDTVDLNQYRDLVRAKFKSYPMPHPEMEKMLEAVEHYRYFTADF